MIKDRLVTRLTLVVGLVAASSVAGAEPSSGYIAAGTEAALGPFAIVNGSITVEGGYRISKSPWFVHVMTAFGQAASDGQDGSVYQLEGGIERRDCVRDVVCFSSGVDLGYVTSRYQLPMEHHAGLVVRGRGAVDVGGARLRFRIGIDLELASDVVVPHLVPTGGRLVPFGESVGVQLAVIYRL